MAVRLHRCRLMFVKVGAHPCWRVQQALDEAGIEYEVVKQPVRRQKRTDYEALTGDKLLPAIELEDGTVLREESKAMVARIEEGRLPSTAAG